MVRQSQLESLLNSSQEDTIGAKAVVLFIDDFLGLLKQNLNALNEQNKRKDDPVADLSGNAYVELSPDLD